MPTKRKSPKSTVTKRVLRDILVWRALDAVSGITIPSGLKARNAWSGGGVHVGPPKGKPGKKRGLVCEFSIDPGFDNPLIVSVLRAILGGPKVTYKPDGSEWPDPESPPRQS